MDRAHPFLPLGIFPHHGPLGVPSLAPSHEDASLLPLLDVPCHQMVGVRRRHLVVARPQVGLQIPEGTWVVVLGLPSRFLVEVLALAFPSVLVDPADGTWALVRVQVNVVAQNHQVPCPFEVPSFLLGQTHGEEERNLVPVHVPCDQNHLV